MAKARTKRAKRGATSEAGRSRKEMDLERDEATEARWQAAVATAREARDAFLAKLKAVDPKLVEDFKEYRHGWNAMQRHVDALRHELDDGIAALKDDLAALRQDHDDLKPRR